MAKKEKVIPWTHWNFTKAVSKCVSHLVSSCHFKHEVHQVGIFRGQAGSQGRKSASGGEGGAIECKYY